MRSFRTLRRLGLATWVACALFAVPSAHATATHLIPIPVPSVSLPPVLQLPLPTASPLPSLPIVGGLLPHPSVTGVPGVPLPGQLNDTVGGIEGLLGLGGSKGNPTPGPVSGIGNGSTGQKSGNGAGRSTGKNPNVSTNRSHTGVTGLTTLDGIGIITPDQYFSAPYGTVTRQAVSKAAGRVLALVGPLAPPLMLAIVALAVLLMLSRGSTRLVKLDVAGLARRTWRI
jgi:hypothetical protein